MGWAEARRLAEVAFTELSLQAIYAFRQGNPVPPSRGHALVGRSRRRVLQSKAMVGGLLVLLSIGSALALRTTSAEQELLFRVVLPAGLFEVAILTALLSLVVALLWWTGLQALPTLLTSGVLEVLRPLPIDARTLRRTAGIVYLRLFDLPAAVVLVVLPLAVGWALGLPAGLAIVPAALSAVVFALALALLTGRFFVRRIQGSRGGGGRTIARWGYLALWLVPAFGILGFITLAPSFFGLLADLTARPTSPAAYLLLLAYPFPMAVVPVLSAGGSGATDLASLPLLPVIAAVGLYSDLAVWAGVWLFGTVADVGLLPAAEPKGARSPSGSIAPQVPPLAVLTKDLRIASRTPGYAFLILLPMLDALALGLVSVTGPQSASAARGLAFGAVSAAALLATFFGPAFFALEVLAQSYARTLPLSQRSVVLGKATLVVAIYLAASALVLGITLARVHAAGLFAAFVGAELPAVAAAALLELGILFRWGRSRGQPVTNLYAGTFNIVLVSVPGLLVVAAPLAVYETGGLLVMTLLGLAELAACAPIALGRGRS